MRHIKRAKASLVSLLLGENKTHITPTVAVFLTPPKNMSVSTAQDDGEGYAIVKYEVSGIEEIDNDVDNTLVNMYFRSILKQEYADMEADEYMVTIPMHYIAVANALSLSNTDFTMIIVDKNHLAMGQDNTVNVEGILATIMFPEIGTDEYDELMECLSGMVSEYYIEPLSSHTIENAGKGINSIPEPLRRAQFAILPLLAGLATDDVLTLKTIMSLEPFFDDFHQRNHNKDVDTKVTAEEYERLLNNVLNSPIVKVEDVIPDSEDTPYSIIENMTDGIQEFIIKNDSNVYQREYYSDTTALVFVTNVKSLYERNNSDSFLTTRPIVSEDREDEVTPGLHTTFMSLAEDSLSGLFEKVDESLVKRTPIEQLWATDLHKWRQSPRDYWPVSLAEIESEIKASENADAYYAVMESPIKDVTEWHSLVRKYGLGVVVTAVMVKSAINLMKFKDIVDVGREEPLPAVTLATSWMTKPDDEYLWEIPAFAYSVANYKMEGFLSLLKCEKKGFPVYLSLILGQFINLLRTEGWDKEGMEWHLSLSGLPAKYQDSLLELVQSINDFEIDPEELEEYEFDDDEEGVQDFISYKICEALFNDETFDPEEMAKMLAYAIPTLADIHVDSHPIEDVVDDMGSLNWKRHRVQYVQSFFEMIVDGMERSRL